MAAGAHFQAAPRRPQGAAVQVCGQLCKFAVRLRSEGACCPADALHCHRLPCCCRPPLLLAVPLPLLVPLTGMLSLLHPFLCSGRMPRRRKPGGASASLCQTEPRHAAILLPSHVIWRPGLSAAGCTICPIACRQDWSDLAGALEPLGLLPDALPRRPPAPLQLHLPQPQGIFKKSRTFQNKKGACCGGGMWLHWKPCSTKSVAVWLRAATAFVLLQGAEVRA